MAWEQRGNSQYFYTAKRKNGRVVKMYFGNGEAARRQAEHADLLKLLEKKNQQRIQQEMNSLDELDRGVAEQAETGATAATQSATQHPSAAPVPPATR